MTASSFEEFLVERDGREMMVDRMVGGYASEVHEKKKERGGKRKERKEKEGKKKT